jgi:uncharacterized membrane protein YphA (DoxX/SURF4 family)
MKEKKLVFSARVFLFLAFLFFGIGKFIVSPEQAAYYFDKLGGVTALYFVGAYETVAAILVIIPVTALLGAILIAIAMIVVLFLHVFVLGIDIFILVAVAFLLIAIYVIVNLRRKR